MRLNGSARTPPRPGTQWVSAVPKVLGRHTPTHTHSRSQRCTHSLAQPGVHWRLGIISFCALFRKLALFATKTNVDSFGQSHLTFCCLQHCCLPRFRARCCYCFPCRWQHDVCMPQDTIRVSTCVFVCVCVEGTTKVVNVVVACRIVCCRLPCAFVCFICLVLRVAILFALCHTRTFTHAATHIKATLVYLLCLSFSLCRTYCHIYFTRW